MIMLDATKSEEQRRLLEIELDAVGIRLNKKKPDVVFKRKTTGGVRGPFSVCGTDVIALTAVHPSIFCASKIDHREFDRIK